MDSSSEWKELEKLFSWLQKKCFLPLNVKVVFNWEKKRFFVVLITIDFWRQIFFFSFQPVHVQSNQSSSVRSLIDSIRLIDESNRIFSCKKCEKTFNNEENIGMFKQEFYHFRCFLCVDCEKPLSHQSFYLDESSPLNVIKRSNC